MGANGTETLSLDQIVDLLPDDFSPVEITDRRKQCASSAKGVVYLRSSQDFFPASWHVMFRYSAVEADASYFAIALGKRGILLIPAHELLVYAHKYAAAKRKGDNQKLHIKSDRNDMTRFYLYEPGAPTIDLTDYFIPAKPPRTYSYQFSKFRVSIFTCCDKPNEPVSAYTVRKFVSETIQRTLDAGENPYRQARQADVHTLRSWTTNIPSVGIEEEMFDARNQDKLAAWIMGTDEMQEALDMFRGMRPTDDNDPECRAWEMDDEAVYEIQVDQLLAYLIPTEGDWQ